MSELSERALRAIAVLRNYPETMRSDLLVFPGFKEEYDIASEAYITFGANDLRFLRSALFEAIRKLYSGQFSSRAIETLDERSCELSLKNEGEEVFVNCKVCEHIYLLPRFALLSPVQGDRLAEFDHLTAQYNLHDPSTYAWRRRVSESSLSNEELGHLIQDLDLNPHKVMQKIRAQVSVGQGDISTVVPNNSSYYDRLIGFCPERADLSSFVSGPLKSHIEKLLSWDFSRGFLFSLLLAGHSTISDLIDVGERPSSDVEKVFSWLVERGDRLSQIAGVELGMRIIDRYPGISANLIRLIEGMRDDNPQATDSRFALSASLFIFVDGELSRLGVLDDKPPFWRRLAAMAQAALFERELIEGHLDIGAFLERATQGRGFDFYVQAMADLRVEPRWLPDFMTPGGLKSEAISRIVNAGKRLSDLDVAAELRTLLQAEGADGILSLIRYPQSYLPGPLEGGTIASLDVPEEMIEGLRARPEEGLLSSKLLAGLINSALVFRIGEEHSKLATEALRRVRHQVAMGDSNQEAFSVLAGLAVVAAVTRSVDLARDVRILARVLRRRADTHFDVDDLIRVGMIAAAANRGLEEWSQTVGEWFEELALESLSAEEADLFHQFLHKLRVKVPELWRYSTKADAALAAMRGSV